MTAVVTVMFGKGTEDPGIILLSDRMVSYGQMGVESSNSKLYRIRDKNGVTAVMGAAGNLSMINEFYDRLIDCYEIRNALTVKEIAEKAASIQASIAKGRVENIILKPHGLTFQQFHRDEVSDKLKEVLVDKMLEEVDDVLDGANSTEIIIAGVDKGGAHIYRIENFESKVRDMIGYDTSGSGFEPANWILMHKAYNPINDEKYALFMSAFAKFQAEQSWGVGKNTDGLLIKSNSIEKINDEEISNLRIIVERLIKIDNINVDKELTKYSNGGS